LQSFFKVKNHSDLEVVAARLHCMKKESEFQRLFVVRKLLNLAITNETKTIPVKPHERLFFWKGLSRQFLEMLARAFSLGMA